MISMLFLLSIQRVRSRRAICPRPGQSRWGTASALTAIFRISTRPWPLSSVSAVLRSGGSPSKHRLAPKGGKIAERFSDTGFQGGLIVFDGEEIMAVAVADMTADLALHKDRIAGNDPALQRHALCEDADIR